MQDYSEWVLEGIGIIIDDGRHDEAIAKGIRVAAIQLKRIADALEYANETAEEARLAKVNHEDEK